MTLHTNGLRGASIGTPTEEFRRAMAAHETRTDKRTAKGEDTDHPTKLGMGMVLAARGNVYGDEGRVAPAEVARRRAANKAARKARRNDRGAASTTISTGGGGSLLGVLFVVFLVLKLAEVGDVADWSWWWVTAPLWAPALLVLTLAVVGGGIFLGIAAFGRKGSRR